MREIFDLTGRSDASGNGKFPSATVLRAVSSYYHTNVEMAFQPSTWRILHDKKNDEFLAGDIDR